MMVMCVRGTCVVSCHRVPLVVRHATHPIPRPGQKHDERRLSLLHVLEPVFVDADRATLGTVRFHQRRRRETTEGFLRSQTGTAVADDGLKHNDNF